MENGKNTECGKPLFVSVKNNNIHPIFFDDNIENTDKSIVDCKNTYTNKTMEYKSAIDKYIIRVNTLEACMNPDYFKMKLVVAEKNK